MFIINLVFGLERMQNSVEAYESNFEAQKEIFKHIILEKNYRNNNKLHPLMKRCLNTTIFGLKVTFVDYPS